MNAVPGGEKMEETGETEKRDWRRWAVRPTCQRHGAKTALPRAPVIARGEFRPLDRHPTEITTFGSNVQIRTFVFYKFRISFIP